MSSQPPPPPRDPAYPPPSPRPTSPARPAGGPGTTGAGVVLLVMALTSMLVSGVPDALTHSVFGDGEGEGDVGVLKLYVSAQVANALVALGLVLLAGALTCFALTLVRRARR
ncbi:hypothetical protein INN71_04495 [Nocardioides sp. ChNu-153]|uniref:hypothetical protein n=1 Tax=unclassified Nocardioides TaxID=2615069 RepID=UPI0024061C50|nr:MULTISPECIES: hypothetical protein [unclassified Nocardioides]MDF9715484.1 hypothetical protein [Nocardioides sp. ChNu-99]MDN7120647.1 hypothetical protein [Nocardioides sp. ChNu-153]